MCPPDPNRKPPFVKLGRGNGQKPAKTIWQNIKDSPRLFMILFVFCGLLIGDALGNAIMGMAVGTFVGVLVDEARRQKREKNNKPND